MAHEIATARLLAPGQDSTTPAPARRPGPGLARRGAARPNPWEGRKPDSEPINVSGRGRPNAANHSTFRHSDEHDELGGEMEWRGLDPMEYRAVRQ